MFLRFIKKTEVFLVNFFDYHRFELSIYACWIINIYNVHCFFYYDNFLFFVYLVFFLGILIQLINYDNTFYDIETQNKLLGKIIDGDKNNLVFLADENFKIIYMNSLLYYYLNEQKFPNIKNTSVNNVIVNLFKEEEIVQKINNLIDQVKDKKKGSCFDLIVKGKQVYINANPISFDKCFYTSIHISSNLRNEKEKAIDFNLLNQLNTGFIVLNKKYSIIFCNKSFLSWFNSSIEIVQGLNFYKIIDQSPMGENVDLDNGVAFIEINNKKIFCSWKKELTLNKYQIDELVLFSINRDKKQIRNDLFENIFQEIPNGIACVDNNKNIIFSNNTFNSYFGKENKNINNLSELPQIFSEYYEKLIQTKNAKNTFLYEVANKTRQNEIYLNVEYKVIKSYTNATFFFVNNVSEYLKQEKQLLHAQRLMVMGEILGGVIHNLNNLFTPILGYCENLVNKINVFDERYTYLMHIKNNAARAANLVRHLLNMSRKENSKEYVSNVNLTICSLLLSLGKLLGSSIDIKFNQGKNIVPIAIDTTNLEQILTNLLVNSRDAILEKDSKKYSYIIVSTEVLYTQNPNEKNPQLINQKQKYVKITVEDNGSGISHQNLRQIFDPFFTTKKSNGVGLGLSMVKKIIQNYNGFINIESKENIGTKFSIFFPELENVAVEKKEEDNPQKKILCESGNILVVDDENSVRSLLTEYLRQIGYYVIEASCGKEAIKELENTKKQIHLLISDILLPDITVTELFFTVRKKFPLLNLVLISGTFHDDLEKELSGINYKFIQKPFSLDDIVKATGTLISDESEEA